MAHSAQPEMLTAQSTKQFKFINIDRVALTAAAAGLLSTFAAGFVTFKPNRIAAGEAFSLAASVPLQGFLAFLALWILVALLSISGIRLEKQAVFTSICGGSLLLLTFFLAGQYATTATLEHGSISRISPGTGMWIMVFAEVVLLLNAVQRGGERTRFITALSAATVAGFVFLLLTGHLNDISIMKEYFNRQDRFFSEFKVHLLLATSSVGAATLLDIPLGILALKKKSLDAPTFFTLNILQTIPSLALFGILIPLLAYLSARYSLIREIGVQGIGWAPAVTALTLYSILPIARNTYAGFATVDPGALDAGLGMGMTRTQLLMKVEIPIASPVILNGIRIALVQTIGLTAVAALIGAGGFGVFIFQGLGQAAVDLILLGAIPTILLAVAADGITNWCIAVIQPRGIR